MEKTINWHYISKEGLPKLKGDKPKLFLVCLHQELGERVTFGGFSNIIPTGKFFDYCTIALFQNKESKDGFAYTPAKKFYWGPEIFDNAYAWAELPEVAEYLDDEEK